MRDSLESGDMNLSNKVDGKDLMVLDDDYHSRNQKQIVWHCRVLHEDLQKVSQQFIYL